MTHWIGGFYSSVADYPDSGFQSLGDRYRYIQRNAVPFKYVCLCVAQNSTISREWSVTWTQRSLWYSISLHILIAITQSLRLTEYNLQYIIAAQIYENLYSNSRDYDFYHTLCGLYRNYITDCVRKLNKEWIQSGFTCFISNSFTVTIKILFLRAKNLFYSTISRAYFSSTSDVKLN